MTTYRWTEIGYVAKDTGAPMELPDRAEIEAPMVMNDIPEYNSPIRLNFKSIQFIIDFVIINSVIINSTIK